MADLVLIVGPSGTGKSTAGQNLSPEETFWINADQKSLPFKGWKAKYTEENKNYAKVSDANKVLSYLKSINEKAPHVKCIVIDTLNRIMSDKVMSERNIKGFEKWSHLSGGIYDLFTYVNHHMRDDLVVFMLCHSEEGYSDMGAQYKKIAVWGKQLDTVKLESMSTIVLFTKVVNDPQKGSKYYFETQTDGTSTAKSPVGMFDELLIPNDYKEVMESIDKYNKGE